MEQYNLKTIEQKQVELKEVINDLEQIMSNFYAKLEEYVDLETKINYLPNNQQVKLYNEQKKKIEEIKNKLDHIKSKDKTLLENKKTAATKKANFKNELKSKEKQLKKFVKSNNLLEYVEQDNFNDSLQVLIKQKEKELKIIRTKILFAYPKYEKTATEFKQLLSNLSEKDRTEHNQLFLANTQLLKTYEKLKEQFSVVIKSKQISDCVTYYISQKEKLFN